ncbi:MAG TPA: cytochrome b/b6 domain-containing protein [Rhodothermales bacterium]|nr:cytochrome b/b6 domain-containing protein [Rhodothermales bacterium]
MKAVRKHPRAVRWMHWANVPFLAVMVWSGLEIYWAHDPYRIGWGDWTLFHFFPQGFYRALGLNQKLAEGMAYHFVFAWLFTLNGVAYALYTAFSGEWRHLVPRRLRDVRDALRVTLHDLRLRKEKPRQGRYNAAQRFAYTGVVGLGVGMVLTGLAMYKPTQLAWLTALLGGYETARFLHFWTATGLVLFVLVHVLQVVRAGWSNFRSMVVGYEPVVPQVPVVPTDASSPPAP